jgi:hypothetical protein
MEQDEIIEITPVEHDQVVERLRIFLEDEGLWGWWWDDEEWQLIEMRTEDKIHWEVLIKILYPPYENVETILELHGLEEDSEVVTVGDSEADFDKTYKRVKVKDVTE